MDEISLFFPFFFHQWQVFKPNLKKRKLNADFTRKIGFPKLIPKVLQYLPYINQLKLLTCEIFVKKVLLKNTKYNQNLINVKWS